jgi:hypothetical protein
MPEVKLPSSVELGAALLKVLAGSPTGLTTKEIDEAVSAHLNLTAEQMSAIRSGNRTEFAYRLAWERTRAKSKGLIVRSSARTWKLN